MGDDIEFDLRLLEAENTPQDAGNLGSLFENERMKRGGVVRVGPAPIVMKLKAREVIGAIHDGARHRQFLIAVSTGAENPKDIGVGLQFNGQEQQPDLQPVQGAFRQVRSKKMAQ